MTAKKLMGKKVGMVQLFDEKGHVVPCSVIKVDANVISQVKTQEKDGYKAIQLAAFKKEKQRGSKPLKGHFSKADLPFFEQLMEVRVDDLSDYKMGQELSLELFAEEKYLDIVGVSKGKGYQGLMKKYNFSGGPAKHGSKFHRHAGSTGMRSTPGRCLPGGKRPSRMGGEQKSIQSLKVVKVDLDEGLVIVKGAIPGCVGSKVVIQTAVKKVKAVRG